MSKPKDATIGRRDFMGKTALAAGITILKPRIVFGSQANSAMRLGLLGCGGRGSSVMGSFLEHTGAVLVAIGDAFPDQLEHGEERGSTRSSAKFGKPAVDREEPLQGPERLRGALREQGRGRGLRRDPALVPPRSTSRRRSRAGKHVYLEKPVAVDVPGAKTRDGARREGRSGKLSLAVGFQIRHASPYVELAKRIHAGADRHSRSRARSTTSPRRSSGPSGRTRRPRRAPAAQLGPRHSPLGRHHRRAEHPHHRRHQLDAEGQPGEGGRLGRPRRAHRRRAIASGHFNCVFTYPGNVHVSFASTQFGSAKPGGVGMQYFGTKGWAEARYDAPVRIAGESAMGVPGPQEARARRTRRPR